MRIAIVGSGVTGLVAARELHNEHEITVLEQHDYLGGHARTVVIPEQERSVAVDVGFIVFNERNYPRFSRLLHALGDVALDSACTGYRGQFCFSAF